jgi:hypothetical protein
MDYKHTLSLIIFSILLPIFQLPPEIKAEKMLYNRNFIIGMCKSIIVLNKFEGICLFETDPYNFRL